MNNKDKYLLNIDLQLFSGDEKDYDDFDLDDDDLDNDFDIDDDSYFDGEEEEDDEEDSTGESNEDSDKQEKSEEKEKADTSAKAKDRDKITHALIDQKRLNKILKNKLEAIENKSKQEEEQNKRKLLINKLVDAGYDDEEAIVEADKRLENEAIKNTVKKLEFMTENADVLSQFPKAKQNIDKLIKIQKSTGWSLEKICKIEYEDTKNSFDKKILSDQEARIKNKKYASNPIPGQGPIKSYKLDSADEKAYQFYARKNPGVSRKQYAQNLGIGNSQKIAHDEWD